MKRIKELVDILSKASYAYYGLDRPIMTDYEYDRLYDELEKLENETGIHLAGSPTQKVQGYILEGFKKVVHTKPMLSANKTKSIRTIEKFVEDKNYYCSYKLDGSTLVCRYSNGEFIQGISRGNGEVGEDVTDACKFIGNIPMTIPYKEDLEVRGECVMSWKEFERINSTLEDQYNHPRNLASGTLRQLDLNIVKNRNLSFVVFEWVNTDFEYKSDALTYLDSLGFETVTRYIPDEFMDDVQSCVDALPADAYQYPVDGLIFEYNDVEYSKSLGITSHHENCRMALKWKDSVYETTLRAVEWSMGKTNKIVPTAVFDPVNLDGAITTRATLHNISYIKKLKLGIGDSIGVIRANMVIPRVEENYTMSNNLEIPDTCPVCGAKAIVKKENAAEELFCTNATCSGKFLGRLTQFVSKDGMNIDGLSETTLKKMVDTGLVTTFRDIYHLFEHTEELKKMNRMGSALVRKLLKSIEASRTTTISQFIYSLSVPMVGRSASKTIQKYIEKLHPTEDPFVAFIRLVEDRFSWSQLDDFGEKMSYEMSKYFRANLDAVKELANELKFPVKDTNKNNTLGNRPAQNPNMKIHGKTFVITGSLENYSSRDILKEEIESLGGKVSGSVSSKTDYLICNSDAMTGKYKKAKELNVNCITEREYISMKEGD